MKTPQPSPLLSMLISPPLQKSNIPLPLQTPSGNLAINPDILHQRVRRHVVVFRPDVPQDQQVQASVVEVGEFVERFFIFFFFCGW